MKLAQTLIVLAAICSNAVQLDEHKQSKEKHSTWKPSPADGSSFVQVAASIPKKSKAAKKTTTTQHEAQHKAHKHISHPHHKASKANVKEAEAMLSHDMETKPFKKLSKDEKLVLGMRTDEWIEAAAQEAGVLDGDKTIDDMPTFFNERRDFRPLHMVLAMDEHKGRDRYESMLMQAKMHNLVLHTTPWLDKNKFRSKAHLTNVLLSKLLTIAENIDIPDDDYVVVTQDDTIFHRFFRHELQKSLDSLPSFWNVFHLCPFLISQGPFKLPHGKPFPFKPAVTSAYEDTQEFAWRDHPRSYNIRLIHYMNSTTEAFLGGSLSFAVKKAFIPYMLEEHKRMAHEMSHPLADDQSVLYMANASHFIARDPQLCVSGLDTPSMYGMRENAKQDGSYLYKVAPYRNSTQLLKRFLKPYASYDLYSDMDYPCGNVSCQHKALFGALFVIVHIILAFSILMASLMCCGCCVGKSQDHFLGAEADETPLSMPRIVGHPLQPSPKIAGWEKKILYLVSWTAIIVMPLTAGLDIWERHSAEGQEQIICTVLVAMASVFWWFLLMVTSFDGIKYTQVTEQELIDIENDPECRNPVVVIPSYKEPDSILLRSMIPACFQFYPTAEGTTRYLIVLIDDPENKGPEKCSLDLVTQFSNEHVALRESVTKAADLFTKVELVQGYLHTLRDRIIERDLEEKYPINDAIYTNLDAINLQLSNFLRQLRTANRMNRNDPKVSLIRQKVDKWIKNLLNCHVAYFQRKHYEELGPFRRSKAANINDFYQCMRNGKLTMTGAKISLNRHGGPVFKLDSNVGIVDADTTVNPGWLLQLTRLLRLEPECGVAFSHMVYGNSQNLVQHACEADMEFSRYAFSGMGRDVYWVGTNGLVSSRVGRLDETCLLQDSTNIEDLETTTFLWMHGMHCSIWNDLVLATSIGPKSMSGYVVQRERWFIGPLNLLGRIWCSWKVKNRFFKSIFIFVPMQMLFTYVLFSYLIWNHVTLHYAFLYFTIAFACFTLYLMARKRVSTIPVAAVTLTWMMMIPVVFIALSKTLINCISPKKVGFIRTPREANWLTTIGVPYHYIAMYLIMFLSSVLSLCIGIYEAVVDNPYNPNAMLWDSFVSWRGFFFFTSLAATVAILFSDPFCDSCYRNRLFSSLRDPKFPEYVRVLTDKRANKHVSQELSAISASNSRAVSYAEQKVQV